MVKYLEIKWHGRAGQGVTTAASILAEIAALAGKYVQAFPQFIPVKRSPSIMAFNRVSDVPIRTHAEVETAGVVVLMDVRLSLYVDVKMRTAKEAVYFINTHSEPDFIKEKLNLSDSNRIITLDADRIVREQVGGGYPNIPLLTVLFSHLQMIAMETYLDELKKILTRDFGVESAAVQLQTVEKAMKEVKYYEPEKVG